MNSRAVYVVAADDEAVAAAVSSALGSTVVRQDQPDEIWLTASPLEVYIVRGDSSADLVGLGLPARVLDVWCEGDRLTPVVELVIAIQDAGFAVAVDPLDVELVKALAA